MNPADIAKALGAAAQVIVTLYNIVEEQKRRLPVGSKERLEVERLNNEARAILRDVLAYETLDERGP